VQGKIGEKGLSKRQQPRTSQQQAMMVFDCWCWLIDLSRTQKMSQLIAGLFQGSELLK
jgi:hypothetical protein